jgi:hypothetical protein
MILKLFIDFSFRSARKLKDIYKQLLFMFYDNKNMN